MRRPFKDVRPIGPFVKSYSMPTVVRDKDEFVFTFHIKGDVTEYGAQPKSEFANFVKGALSDYDVYTYSYALPEVGREPYTEDTYKTFARMSSISKSELEDVIDKVNDRVGGMSAPEFRVEDITFEPRERQ